jgi:hypothetical protein
MVSGAWVQLAKLAMLFERGGSPEDLGVHSGPVVDAAIEGAHMDEIPGARLQILPPVFHVLLEEADVGGDAEMRVSATIQSEEKVERTIRAG